MSDARKLDTTDVLETPHGTFVVTGVQYQEVDGEHVNFTYQIKDPADLIADEPEINEDLSEAEA